MLTERQLNTAFISDVTTETTFETGAVDVSRQLHSSSRVKKPKEARSHGDSLRTLLSGSILGPVANRPVTGADSGKLARLQSI